MACDLVRVSNQILYLILRHTLQMEYRRKHFAVDDLFLYLTLSAEGTEKFSEFHLITIGLYVTLSQLAVRLEYFGCTLK
jgi:hypothetical protein